MKLEDIIVPASKYDKEYIKENAIYKQMALITEAIEQGMTQTHWIFQDLEYRDLDSNYEMAKLFEKQGYTFDAYSTQVKW